MFEFGEGIISTFQADLSRGIVVEASTVPDLSRAPFRPDAIGSIELPKRLLVIQAFGSDEAP